MKGWIALDIDGTITQDKYSIPKEVIDFLHCCYHSGWKIVFATGRAFIFAKQAIEKISFPFFIMPQNGSVAIQMPAQDILFKRYMSPAVITDFEEIFEGRNSHYLVYSGVENGDRCYFQPNRFSKTDRIYLEEIQKREKEEWVTGPIDFEIPLIKCFGKLETMKKVKKELLKKGLFEATLIRDPFHNSYYMLLITNKNTSKGSSLQEIISRVGRGKIVIAAGDDVNDIELLQVADIRIAMPHAPEELRKIADFIAPPLSEMGIIQALKIVIDARDRFSNTCR